MAPQYLEAAILDSGRVAFEFHSAKEAVNSDRREIEKHLFEIDETDPALALLVLGLVAPSSDLSPSMEFWRGFYTSFAHTLRAAPETETER
ncbi:MAG: hypothetical protein EXS63_02565 [Candidatus Omnitrophica bacterium]|nr:hypothetical protein [Candidatus Omnitrophota bacterium]